MRRVVSIFALVAGRAASAQTPFVNLIWEANDGRGWTRQHLVTAQTAVQVRLLAEWGGGTAGVCFSGVSFDALVSNSPSGDTVSNIVRVSPFAFQGQTLASLRFGSVLKLDDAVDSLAPGAGGSWIRVLQAPPSFGEGFDPSNPALLFSYTLNLEAIATTRRATMITKIIANQQTENAGINTLASVIFVTAPIEAIDIEYVPAPTGFAVVLAGLGVFSRRVRRA